MTGRAPASAPAPARPCAHCGLPVGRVGHVRVVEGEERAFCCIGCGIAWRLAGRGGREGGSESSAFLARVGLGVVLSMLVMLVAWVPYLDPSAAADPAYETFAPWATLAAATPVVLLLGLPFLWNAVAALRRGRVGTDLLVGIGIFSAYGASLVALASGRPDALFLDTAAGLATLVTLGRFLEATAKERAARRLREFLSASARPALRLARGATLADAAAREPVRASDLRVGDSVLVLPGASVPTDGVVEDGRALLDEAALTGEPLPRPVGPGDAVRAPTVPTDGPLVVRATAVGEGTRLAEVARVLARARAERSPAERLADRVAAVFVPAVVALAAVVLASDLAGGEGVAAASLHALSVLVIACPCALGIATPLAVTAAVGRLAERGILVRSGLALSTIPRLRAVAFDKTGTLTEGAPRVAEVLLESNVRPAADPSIGAAEGAQIERNAAGRIGGIEALALAAAVESTSEHALARAVVAAAGERGTVVPPARDVRVVAGRGVEGVVPTDGGLVRVRVGSPAWIASREGGGAPAEEARATEVLVEVQGEVVATLRLDDRLRPSAAPAVASLRASGLRVSVLSGDSAGAVQAVARDLGLPPDEAHGHLLPADKVEAVAALRRESGGPVAFVGDGLNDAPALAAADVGIAVGSGTDLARETADASLLGDDLGRLPGLFRAARRTRAAIRWNLFWAFAYNVLGVGLAVVSRLPPVFAAGAMVASSLLVVGNSARLRAVLPDDLAPPRPAGGPRPSAGIIPPWRSRSRSTG
jgi:Cu2+-exporting ATPase